MQSEFSKVLKKILGIESIVLGIIATALSTILLGILQAKTLSSDYKGYFAILTIAVLACFAFLVAYLHVFRHDLLNTIDNKNPILKLIGENEAFDILFRAIKNSTRSIYIVGDGYKEAEGSENIDNISFLFELIHRKCCSPKTPQNFNYTRITSKKLDPDSSLYKHIKNILSNCTDKSLMKFSFQDNFDMAYTYTIIDDKLLLLHIINDKNAKEYETSFMSENEDIISHYVNHFNRLKEKSTFIKNVAELDIELNKFKSLDEKYNELKNKLSCFILEDAVNAGTRSSSLIKDLEHEFIYLNKFTSDLTKDLERFKENQIIYNKLSEIYQIIRDSIKGSIGNSLALKEIDQAYERISGLKNGITKFHHSRGTGRLPNLFLNILDSLKKDDIYQAVSVYNFWKNFDPNERRNIINKMEALIKLGVKFERYYLIKDTDLHDDNAVNDLAQQLKYHYKLSNNSDGNYIFGFCIMNEEEFTYHRYNLTLITQNLSDCLPEGNCINILKVHHNIFNNSLEEFYTDLYSFYQSEDHKVEGKKSIYDETINDFNTIKSYCESQSKNLNVNPSYVLLHNLLNQ